MSFSIAMSLPSRLDCAALLLLALAVPLTAQEDGAGDPGAAQAPTLVELNTQAGEAVKVGDWTRAVDLYGKLVDRDPLNPMARANYGSALFRTSQFTAARIELEKATMMEPKAANSWATLALIYQREEKLWLALSAISRAVDLEPRQPRWRILLALILDQQSWRDAAEHQLLAALEIDPDSADAHFNLAVLSVQRTPPAVETARRHYRRARDLGADPDGKIESILFEADRE